MAKKAEKQKPKDKDKAAEPLKLERVVERVRHDFNQAEIAEFGREVARGVRALKVVESERKSIAAQYASQEKTLAIEIDEFSRKIGDGYEMRRKACYCLKDFKNEQVYYFLCDNLEDWNFENFATAADLLEQLLKDEAFEPIKTRMLRADERQMNLFESEGDTGDDDDHTAPDSETEGKEVVTD